jgi:hypothetical protein
MEKINAKAISIEGKYSNSSQKWTTLLVDLYKTVFYLTNALRNASIK